MYIVLLSVGCIWQFNCCIQDKVNVGETESICYTDFNQCKMVVMGMMPMVGGNDMSDGGR